MPTCTTPSRTSKPSASHAPGWSATVTSSTTTALEASLDRMANRLADETSPYLLQHKDNPVDWNPWGEEALARARAEDKPLLVSIGYSACHWCHVMERESFEDPEAAAFMNEHFVCVKVDREERPDVDAIYMEACQAMTGQGGWPLNVFLTPEQVPFYAGTYFPPEQTHGHAELAARARGGGRGVGVQARRDPRRRRPDRAAAPGRRAAPARPTTRSTRRSSTPRWRDCAAPTTRSIGGFGGAPKFPPRRRDRVPAAPRRDRDDEPHAPRDGRGGMYDQVGGGFARYSVDAEWLVPHFEKMLYDNALLARAYLHGWQVTGEPLFRRVC